jgi:hypothetical protein
MNTKTRESTKARKAKLEIDPTTFRELGHRLVDQIAEHLARLPEGPVTRAEPAATVRQALGAGRGLPESELRLLDARTDGH